LFKIPYSLSENNAIATVTFLISFCTFHYLATNCSILSCGEKEECVQVDNIFKCVCKDDYEGPDCQLGETEVFHLGKILPLRKEQKTSFSFEINFCH
jgi:hypothetical protein